MAESSRDERPSDDEKCDSHHLDAAAPSHGWTLDQLTAAAREEWAAILTAEKTTTARYWRLGQVLHLARKQFAHGQWIGYLKELGIEKTRALKAMRIFETFSTAAQTAGLTVAEAYARRERRPRAARKQDQPPDDAQVENLTPRPRPSWSQFVTALIAEADRLADEIDFQSVDTIVHDIEQTAHALASLRRLEERLQSRYRELLAAAEN